MVFQYLTYSISYECMDSHPLPTQTHVRIAEGASPQQSGYISEFNTINKIYTYTHFVYILASVLLHFVHLCQIVWKGSSVCMCVCVCPISTSYLLITLKAH